ncbi:hypothetical protein MHU86_313 [Fragilaria crotonensis]|nr:hypothetical protein MHU86_313 [Fragilaria crotonensis]
MTSGTNPEYHIIRQHSNDTELKGLGVYMNFTGTFAQHAATLRIKVDGMARRLLQSSLSPAMSKLFYNSFYLPSVRYSLPITSMSSGTLHKIQSLMTASILNKLGYNRHYPHAVAFAPSSVFGCGLIDLRVEQGLTHIQSFIDYVGTQHKVGQVMLISLRHLQIESGVSFDLLSSPQIELTYLTDCWILHLRKFCAEHNISIYVKKNRLPLISREGDSLLMDMAITMGLKKQELIDLNLVRIFLGVTTVSDIATADGLRIHPCTWKGYPIPDRRQELHEAERTLSVPLIPRNLEVAVQYDQHIISSHYVARLRECISLTHHRTFLQRKYKWSDHTWSCIAWDDFMTCARKPNLTNPVTRSKIVHNWLHLGSQRVKFGSKGNTQEIARCCPYCHQDEDFIHMLTCIDPRAQKFRYDAAIPLLRTVLSKSGDAGTFLLRVIQTWTKTPLDPIVLTPGDSGHDIQAAIDQALESQTNIGWTHLFRGFSYFTLPLETRLRQSPRQRQRWLRLARLATFHSSAKGARQQLLSTYFPYAQLQHEAPSGPALLPSDQPSVPHILQQSSITSYYRRSSPVDGV